jgi:hypothetical protein
MYSVEDYVRRWTKREKKTYILFPVGFRERSVKRVDGSMITHATLNLKDRNVGKHLFHIHSNFVDVPADKAPNNIVLCVNHIK